MGVIKAGVVGLNRGSTLICKSKYCKKLKIEAVCDIDVNKANHVAETYDIPKIYFDYDELLKTDVEAIIIATPINLHTEHVLKAIKAGKHVLSEVIVATTIEDCKKIADALKKSNKKYMMAENYCYIRPISIVKNMAKAGLFGEIYYAESDYLKDFQAYHPSFPNIGGWRQPTYFGRRGHPYITHSLGPIASIMDEKVSRVVCMAAGNSFNMKADNTCVLMCQTENDHMIRLRNSFVSPRPDNFTYYSIQGTKGCYQSAQGPTDFHKIHINGLCKPNEWKNVYDFKEYIPKEWNMLPEVGDTSNTNDNDPYAIYDLGTPIMLDEFADCILNVDKKIPAGLSDAINWTITGIMSETSVENGFLPVDIPNLMNLL